MKISARNQLSGTVLAVRLGSVNAEVDILLPGGTTIVAQITMPSIEALGIVAGTPVVALVKSSWVLVGTGESAPPVSSRNRLRGTVARIVPGAVNSEVEISLAGGGDIVATVTNESARALGLAPGATAWALFKASSVVLMA